MNGEEDVSRSEFEDEEGFDSEEEAEVGRGSDEEGESVGVERVEEEEECSSDTMEA